MQPLESNSDSLPLRRASDLSGGEPPSVLIVDRSRESIQVISEILRRRGVTSISSQRFKDGLELAKRESPRVIVLDEDSLPSGPDSDHGRLLSAVTEKESRLVLIGSFPNPKPPENPDVISKPYHYSDLIRKIEGLLGTGRSTNRAA